MTQYMGMIFGVVSVLCAICALASATIKPEDKPIMVASIILTVIFLAASVLLLK